MRSMLSILVLLIPFHILAQVDGEAYTEGEYLARIGGCAECHSVDLSGQLSGGYALVSPFGTFYTPNITPDLETGLGEWTFEEFKKAMRTGWRPEGGVYYPSFPYRSYSKLTDDDLFNLFTYLQEQKPVHKVNKDHELKFPFNIRFSLLGWKLLFFRGEKTDLKKNLKVGEGPFQEIPEHSDSWNRGAYLVESLLHCAECHTPRNMMGAPIADQWMAGSGNAKFSGLTAPNITPSVEGLKSWTREDWRVFLQSGYRPDGESVYGDMALVIKNTSALLPEDLEAIIDYLTSLEPQPEESQ